MENVKGLKLKIYETHKILYQERRIKNNTVKKLIDEILHYYFDNKRLELNIESKTEEIDKLRNKCTLSKAKECNNEKKWMTMKKEHSEKD